ncbi:MAG: SPOR domain-containing protein [Bacteroidaceae bacterium]|nr:SPOR domain-containing protein [Bacteroidaceae bacterium]
MKKLIYLGAVLLLVLSVSSCKTGESAYKKAYEKAKQQQGSQATTNSTSSASTSRAEVNVTPITTNPSIHEEVVEAPKQVQKSANTDIAVRQERVDVLNGDTVNDFSVVCGSFGTKSNAENLKAFLDNQGYRAVIVHSNDVKLYRVVVASYSSRSTAAAARDAFKRRFSNREDFQAAWLLYRIY